MRKSRMAQPGKDLATNAKRSAPLRIEITAKTMVVAVVVFGGAWVTLRLAPVAMVLVVALFLVGTLSPAVAWLESQKIKRGVGIGMVFAALLLGLTAIVAVTIPTLVAQASDFVREEPALRAKLADTLSHYRATAPLSDSLRNLDYGTLMKSSSSTALAYSKRSAETLAYLFSAFFLALYIMIDRDRLRGALYALVPRSRHIVLSRVLLNLETIVGGYIRGQLLTSALMAAFTFLLLTVCRVKAALAIGVFAGLADVLPYIGTFLSVGPAVAAATSRGSVIVVVVLAAMLAYEEFESRFLVPKIYGNALKLPSSVVLFALLTGGTLMGITGALLALPVAAAIRMLTEELRVVLPGEDVDDSDVHAADARAEHEYEQRAKGVPAEEAAALALEISAKDTTTSNVDKPL